MIEFKEFQSIFHTVMALNGLEEFATEPLAASFYKLTDHMLETNEKMNLTAIKEESAIILLHYADSLIATRYLPQNARTIDVGCGAGFPCLPLALCRPDLSILAADSTEKRIRYVSDTASLLGCQNLSAVAMRAEEGAYRPEYREAFDVCTARAVAALPILAELCLPFVRVGGKFLAMKAKRGEEEWESAASAISKLGGRLIATHRITLTDNGEQDERIIFEIEKIKSTPPAYPRAYAKIVKSPL
jgi:16S rRNA (guanine527-N7)-methyltransferase